MPTTFEDKPIALIVEDKQRAAKARKDLFDAYGFVAIQASSKEEALQHLRSAPAIDIVVTDVNLDPEAPNDKSGVELAKEVRNLRPSMPVIGYSGHFQENDLDPRDWERFDQHLPKGARM